MSPSCFISLIHRVLPSAVWLLPSHVIQRIGHWLLDSFGTSYIVPGFTPEALLALGFWPGAAQKDFSGYWAERFHVAVPLELIYALFPGLKELELRQLLRSRKQLAAHALAGWRQRLQLWHGCCAWGQSWWCKTRGSWLSGSLTTPSTSC